MERLIRNTVIVVCVGCTIIAGIGLALLIVHAPLLFDLLTSGVV